MAKRRKPDWGQLGPMMRALPKESWREFVYAYVTGAPGHGALASAARAAGFGKKSTPTNVAKIAWKLSQDDRIVAAIAECSRKIIRSGAPEAANALLSLIRDPKHKDHGRAVQIMLDRTDPVETRSHHTVDVTHTVLDPDQEALEELRAARALGATRDKLLELFGGNYLPKLERLEAAENAKRADNAKLIDGEAIEVM
jgi:hypothetical protein